MVLVALRSVADLRRGAFDRRRLDGRRLGRDTRPSDSRPCAQSRARRPLDRRRLLRHGEAVGRQVGRRAPALVVLVVAASSNSAASRPAAVRAPMSSASPPKSRARRLRGRASAPAARRSSRGSDRDRRSAAAATSAAASSNARSSGESPASRSTSTRPGAVVASAEQALVGTNLPPHDDDLVPVRIVALTDVGAQRLRGLQEGVLVAPHEKDFEQLELEVAPIRAPPRALSARARRPGRKGRRRCGSRPRPRHRPGRD